MKKTNFDDVFYPDNIKEILYNEVDEKMVDHIKNSNNNYLDEVSMKFMGENVSYTELFKNIEVYAKSLRKYGIKKGDRIVLAMPNIPETIYYFYACNDIGATPYLIDPRSTLNSMKNCIENSKAVLFICEMGTYYSKVAKYADELPIEDIIVVSPVNMFEKRKNINGKAMAGKYLYDLKKFYEALRNISVNGKKCSQSEFLKLADNYVGNYKEEYDPEVPAIIVNTSGTTGSSVKGAMHSNKTYNIYANEAQFVTKHLERGNTYYGYIPYFSMYGSGVGMHTALSYGVIIDNIPKFNGKKSLEEIINTKANILIGTPAMMEKLSNMYSKNNIDASHVKQYIVGGDNMSPEKLKEINDNLLSRGMQSKLVYGYGATECMPVSTTNYDERSYIYGSVGMIYPMEDIRILNPDTLEEMDYNQEGEIYVSNQTLMMGYLNNPEENKLVLKEIDGKTYYKTGDKGYLAETGHLFLTGRYKRMMKRPDGHQVSPIPIENTILNQTIVEDCSVVGIKRIGDKPGMIPTAFVQLKNKEEMEKMFNIDDIIKNIAEESLQNLSGEREAALAYVLIDKIPYTINGKVDFSKLQENVFDNLDYYIIDDPVTREYFEGLQNFKIVKIDKSNIRKLKK